MDQELKAYLDRRFEENNQRFDAIEREVQEARDENHKTRILVEKLDGDIKTVAEGVVGVRESLDQHREEVRRELRDLRSQTQAVLRTHEERLSGHEARIRKLEGRGGSLIGAAK